ncbi:aminodeoxychorismate synthase component I [soil metagenome]
MNIREFKGTLNTWGQNHIPFLFIIDFEMKCPMAFRLSEIDPSTIQYNFRGFTNISKTAKRSSPDIRINPISFENYKQRFDKVMFHLRRGDSFLANLTIATEFTSTLTLEEIFSGSQAKYKLLYKNEFVCFSPEPFVRIIDNTISSFPMKGTIDAIIPNAREIILTNKKELSEHITIVDLIRNDLSQIAHFVEVPDFRYIEEVKTHDKILLQVSSKITGQLPENYLSNIGEILCKLLPAGSVSGAPKVKTVEIIREAEESNRGYYTGVCGYFDGYNLDSGVMIRFIENNDGNLLYRSGGGITAQSNDLEEYQEAIKKIYVPVD